MLVRALSEEATDQTKSSGLDTTPTTTIEHEEEDCSETATQEATQEDEEEDSPTSSVNRVVVVSLSLTAVA